MDQNNVEARVENFVLASTVGVFHANVGRGKGGIQARHQAAIVPHTCPMTGLLGSRPTNSPHLGGHMAGDARHLSRDLYQIISSCI